jgi:hypothetical protein
MFDINKFISFKVNTYGYRDEESGGGCIKCAFNYACGKNISIEKIAHNYPRRLGLSLADYALLDYQFTENWVESEFGLKVAVMLDRAEDMLYAVRGNVTPEAEATIKAYVIGGLKELGVIKEEVLQLC